MPAPVNMVVASAQNGLSSATLSNDLPQSVYVLVYNESTGAMNLLNNGDLLAPGQSVTIRLNALSYYIVEAVNPDM